MLRLTEEEIVLLYRERQSGLDVAISAGCSTEKVYDVLRKHGEPIRKVGGGNKGRYKEYRLSYPEIARRYKAGEGMPTLADAAGCTPSQIRNILTRQGIEPRTTAQANALLAKRRPRRR